ncbi:MAG: hypothetical protein KAH23_03330 [Kiritimatiellae bacterium]|nr:hypothetical protein [Kiritimatiellia bacterium]
MKVLFIGNSYTYGNNLPGMLKDLSNAAGQTLETTMVASGGKTLEWHWYNPATREAIDQGQWDFIVMQDHSLRAVEAPDKLLSAATRLTDRICKVNAKPLFYITWARQHIPEMQDAITETYMRVAQEINAGVAPVGPAWHRAITTSPELSLHVGDRSHPNLLGSYLAACVFYATLFGNTPEGLSNELRLVDGVTAVIDKDKAVFLQKTAWASVQELT